MLAQKIIVFHAPPEQRGRKRSRRFILCAGGISAENMYFTLIIIV